MQKAPLLTIAVIILGAGFKNTDCHSTVPAQLDARNQTRSVKGQVLDSPELPSVRLKFDKGFAYAGSQEFILYGVAHAEQHFFVDADKQGRIKRMYWVQFEGYLPGTTLTYRYRVNKVVDIGGLDFIADAYTRNVTNAGRPDSDSKWARTFLESKGYHMGSDDVMSQRLVHLIGEPKRNELMVLYMEDLAPTGLTAADLGTDGRAAARWDEISKGLLERALKGMEVMK